MSQFAHHHPTVARNAIAGSPTVFSSHVTYRERQMHMEGVSLSEIAQQIGTPVYCYSYSEILDRYFEVSKALSGLDSIVCYAVKANSNQAILSSLVKAGAGLDVLSMGELVRALKAGAKPETIVFSGVAKTTEEIAFAGAHGIFQFNIESEPELELISSVASRDGFVASVAVRANPDIDAKTHRKITTGKAENKFGIPWSRVLDVYQKAASLPGIAVTGVAMHIGSQIRDLAPFDAAFRRIVDLTLALRSRGHKIDRIDIGGGLAIRYEQNEKRPATISQYVDLIKFHFGRLGARVILEPGRLLVGNAGILLSKVLYVKEGSNKSFLVIDAAMNDLIRPTLYDAWHEILPVDQTRLDSVDGLTADVVGGACETGDYLALDRSLPNLQKGDLIAVMTTGAYGAVQAGTYNSRPLLPEVMVRGSQFNVIRPRQTYDELIGSDVLPPWLVPSP